MTVDIQLLKKRADDVFTSPERLANENTWNELAEFMLNNQHNFNGTVSSGATISDGALSNSKGVKKTKRVYDSTALQATQDLAAAFQGTLTNPATVWSEMRFQEDELNDDPESVRWLQDVNRIMHNQFNESNFDTEISKGYQSLVALANMVLFVEESRNEDTNEFEGFRFTSIHLSQVAWGENKDGIVDTLYRNFNMTAKQAFEKWGDSVSDRIKKALEQNPEKEFSFLHCVFPRDPKQVKINSVGLARPEDRPVASVYLESDSKEGLLEEGGFYEMPILVSRWGLMAGERYGRGPSHLAIPDVRTINKVRQLLLEDAALQIRPPILANQRDIFGGLDLRPGQLNVVKDNKGVEPFQSGGRHDLAQFNLEELTKAIKSAFFLDKIQPLNTLEKKERMTQFEVTKRLEEMQAVLGPVVSRLNSEFLQPLIIRAFKILLRSNLLPEMPQNLRELGLDIEIVFVNQLARAQQIQDISNIQQWVQDLSLLAQINPEVVDNIDADGIAKHTAKILGVPEVAVKPREEVEAAREQRAQMQQQQLQLQNANLAADTAAKAGMTGEEEG